ncbi:MAG: sensor histidine kinase [Novosphingobium sp.]|jgi:two-component system phosphate regulon sensor histidine kinase PhoR|uniref:sensor histidine kinase n=1 Tax=Novosphingobium sp. TaxID=1874826 RepID=UPI00391A940D|nr:ATP-binding protein [Novosphingobium sp.]
MTGKLPLPGLFLAALAALGLAVAGVSLPLVGAVVLVWIGSLWLTLPEPELAEIRVDKAEVTRDAVREAIESLGAPLLVLEGTRIVMANAAARAALGAHVQGQDARIALRHPDAMRLLDMADGDSVTIPGFTGTRSLWQLTRRRIDKQRWLIELADRTTEADVSRAHTDFVANASHELRTPLASIIGYVETLEEGGPAVDAEAQKRFLGIVLREARRMLSLVEDLLSLSHAEAEKHDHPTEPLDLGKLAARVVGEVASLRGKEQVQLVAAADGAVVAGDSTQLEQLLRNLIDNALKYGGADSPVEVSVAAPQANTIELAVTDHGPGIAPEHLPHLTRRFYRTDPGRSRASGGTGLGLAIVKHIVERHRGKLDITSTLGEGTRVTVSLPKTELAALS